MHQQNTEASTPSDVQVDEVGCTSSKILKQISLVNTFEELSEVL